MSDVLAVISDQVLDPARFDDFVLDERQGALVTFRGIVRDHDHGESVSQLDYQAHPEAERFLAECCQQVADARGIRIAAGHRTGSLAIGDVALVASVAAAHRADAFAACQELVDLIKQRVPIWKRQHLAEGTTEWVGL